MSLKKTLLVGTAALSFLISSAPLRAQEEIPVPEPVQITDDSGGGGLQEVNPQVPVQQQEPVYQPAPRQQQQYQQQQQQQQPQQYQQQQPQQQYQQQPRAKKFVYVPNPNQWSAFFTLGTTFGVGSTYSVTSTSSTTGTSASADVSSSGDRGGIILGGEIHYRFIPYFQLGLVLDWTKYGYANTALESDSELGIFVLPRTQMEWDMWTFWFGLGLGLQRTGVGATSATTTTETTNTVDSSFSGFAFSPRLGADYEINESLMVGLQFTYTSTKGSLNRVLGVASAASSGNAVDVTRHWFSVALRVGTQW